MLDNDSVPPEPAAEAPGRSECGSRGPRWYVVQTQPHAEHMAQRELDKQGFMPFLPLAARLNKRRVVELVPLFSGYLFACFDIERDRWQAIRSTYGVRALLGSAPERPTPLAQGVVEHWMRQSTLHTVVREVQPPAIPAGSVARVTDGPFADRAGVCLWSNDRCVALLMDLFGAERQVKVAREHVERVG